MTNKEILKKIQEWEEVASCHQVLIEEAELASNEIGVTHERIDDVLDGLGWLSVQLHYIAHSFLVGEVDEPAFDCLDLVDEVIKDVRNIKEEMEKAEKTLERDWGGFLDEQDYALEEIEDLREYL